MNRGKSAARIRALSCARLLAAMAGSQSGFSPLRPIFNLWRETSIVRRMSRRSGLLLAAALTVLVFLLVHAIVEIFFGLPASRPLALALRFAGYALVPGGAILSAFYRESRRKDKLER